MESNSKKIDIDEEVTKEILKAFYRAVYIVKRNIVSQTQAEVGNLYEEES